jgi:two-component system phosphate regulon response regulator PhoB
MTDIKDCTVLIADDSSLNIDLLIATLGNDFNINIAMDGKAALKSVAENPPDLILLDLMLPGKDGLEICRRLKCKKKTQNIPVVMMSACGEESDIVTGLGLGAEDYIVKPFSPKVLCAHVRAVLRHKSSAPELSSDVVIRIYDLVIHPGRYQVLLKGVPLNLSATEFRLLHFLAGRPGWVYTRRQIVDGVHGEGYSVTERSVDVQIVGLRRKLKRAGNYIETVRGIGYCFTANKSGKTSGLEGRRH